MGRARRRRRRDVREPGAEACFAELMADHDRFGLELPAAVDVRACAAALEWEREARDALAFRRDGEDGDELAAGETKTEGNENENENEEPDSNENDDEIPPDVAVLEDLRTRVSELDADILEEMEQPLVEEVTRRLDACDAWTARVDAIFAESGESSRGAPERERESARVGSAASLGASAREGGGSERAGAGGSERAGPIGGSIVSKAKPVSAERAAAEARALAGKRPTPEAVRALVEAGKAARAVPPRVAQLEATLEEHAAWVEAARELLGPAPPEPTAEELAAAASSAAADTADAAALEEALAAERRAAHASSKKGKTKGVRRGSDGGSDDPHRLLAEGETDDAAERARVARRAKSILAAVESRLEKRRAADFVDARPAMGAVLKMLSRGDSQPLRSEEGAALAAAAAAAAAAGPSAPPDVVRPRSSAGAHAAAVEDTASALRVVAQSIRAAIADLEGTGEPPESEEGQFCLCRQPGGKEMIGCDRCGDWYHLRCVQVTANFARTAKHYVCPACRASAPDGDVFELNKPETTHRHIHRTRRASLATLGEALLEAMDSAAGARGGAHRGRVPEHARGDGPSAANARRGVSGRGDGGAGGEGGGRRRRRRGGAADARRARSGRPDRRRRCSTRSVAGTTAMAAAFSARGGGTAATALEATQRAAHSPPSSSWTRSGSRWRGRWRSSSSS